MAGRYIGNENRVTLSADVQTGDLDVVLSAGRHADAGADGGQGSGRG